MSRTLMYFLMHVDSLDPSTDVAHEDVSGRFEQIFTDDNWHETVALITEANRVILGERPGDLSWLHLPEQQLWSGLLMHCRQDANRKLQIEDEAEDRTQAAQFALADYLRATAEIIQQKRSDSLTLYHLHQRVEAVQHLEGVDDEYPFSLYFNDPYHELPYFDLRLSDQEAVDEQLAILILSVHC